MDSATPSIQVFILSYNRPKYLLEALNSVLNQIHEDFAVIVSDNSTEDETEHLLRTRSHPRLRYIRRIPSLPPLEHFRVVLTEVTSEYFMIFHDDDIMLPNCLSLLSKNLDEHPNAAAVGGNASIFWNESPISTGKFLGNRKQEHILTSPEEIAKVCLSFGELAPFPSYMYRRKSLAGLTLEPSEGGKYSDISFLMKVLGRGNIIWEHQVVMRYRKHTEQDSQGVLIKDALLLLAYILKNTKISKHSKEVRYFRHKSWAGVLKGDYYKSSGRFSKARRKKIVRAILYYAPFDIYLKLLIWRIWFLIKKR